MYCNYWINFIAIVFHVYFLFAIIASLLQSYSIFVVFYQNQNVLQGFILNVMENYKVEPKDFNSPLMYHRLIESFKYGYAYRSQIGDPGDKNITRVVSEVRFFSHNWMYPAKHYIIHKNFFLTRLSKSLLQKTLPMKLFWK